MNICWSSAHLGCVCFGFKPFQEIIFVKPCVWLHMENRIFRICISFDRKKKPLTRKLFYISIFTSNHFQIELQMRKEREREREREREKRWARTDRAPVRRPRPHWPQQSLPSQHRADQAKIDSNATRSRLRLRRAISPLDRTQSPLSLPSLNLTGFDEFFFFGFCFFWVYGLRNDIIYLFGS